MPIHEDGLGLRHEWMTTSEGRVEMVIRQIDSSNIAFIAWPRESAYKLLLVQFTSGGRYCYIGVSRQRAVACAYAESSGKYLNERIKPKYEALKVC